MKKRPAPVRLKKKILDLQAENQELRDTLLAIQSGEVDALIVGDEKGERVFTLKGAEQPYRELVEAMNEGAATVSHEGMVLYCNIKFATLVGLPLERIVGSSLNALFKFETKTAFGNLFGSKSLGVGPGETVMAVAKGSSLNVQLSVSDIDIAEMKGYCIVVTDMSERLLIERALRDINIDLEARVGDRTRDLTEALAQFQQSEEQFRTLANTIPQLAWMAHADGHIFWYNHRWSEYTGKTDQEMLGWGWTQVHDPLVLPNVIKEWKYSIEHGVKFEMTFPLKSKDGKFRSFLTRVTPVRDDSGKVVKWFGTCTDIDATVQAQREIEIARKEADRASQTKSAFLANMSHEIRTPLGAILGFTDLLKDRNLNSAEREQFLNTISRNGKALTRIIDDILDLAKVESGKMDIEKVEFSFLDLVEDVLDLFRERARSKSISLRVHIPNDTSRRIISDPTRLRQILINIVGNAVKFTDEGGVTIEILETVSDLKGVQIKILVKDTGPGITLEERTRLFEPFVQADNSTTRKFGGTGLGLVLSKRLAQALGGGISIDPSHVGRGSTFIISFVAELPGAPHSVESLGSASTKLTSGRRLALAGVLVLVAEDSEDNQFLVKRMLENQGATVETADNGLKAFRMGMNGHHDLVLMDIQMPEMDGYEATRALREAGFKRPIIALTAHAMAEERARSAAAGCNGHLTKPLDQAEVLKLIRKSLGLS